MKKVIIDCDVGVDDALALILAFHSPELEVKAVTGVNGNVPLETVFTNIQKVLSLIQPEKKPFIAKGADQPLKGEAVYAHSVHGKSGLGEAQIDLQRGEPWWEVFQGPASKLITKTAHEFPRQLTLIAIGPLTNLALGLKKDRAGMEKLKEVVIMGGAVRTGGNVTPHAEFNIFSDPLAAKIVFESGLPTTLVPLDVTRQVSLTPPWIEEKVKPMNHSFSKFLMDVTGYHLTTHQFRNRERICLHDPLAVGLVIDSTLVKAEKLSIQVDTRKGERYGQTSEVKEGPKIEVGLGVDSNRFLELFLSRLE